MTDQDPKAPRSPRPHGPAVVQRPVSQPAPDRITRPVVTGGARPDLPEFVTRVVKR